MMRWLVLLIIFGLKVFGLITVFRVPLPDSFPPETFFSLVGYRVYQFLDKLVQFLNIRIGFFPSFLVPFLSQVSVKIFFLKFPYLLADFVVLILGFFFLWKFFNRGKTLIGIFLLSVLNFWFWFYFHSQRLLLREEISKFLFKPYKIPEFEKEIFWIFLFIFILALYEIVSLRLSHASETLIKQYLKGFLFSKLVLVTIFVGLVIISLGQIGIFLKLSPSGKVFWKGFWITANGEVNEENLYYIFEKEFKLFFVPKTAKIFSYCENNYRLYLNNVFVGEGGLISPKELTYYDSWEVKTRLRKGKNLVRLECYNPYLDTLSLVKKPAGMIFQLETNNGLMKKRVVSDSSWKAAIDHRYQRRSEFVSKTSGFQEFFNNRNELFLKKAEIIDKPLFSPWENLVPRPIPFLQWTTYEPGKKVKTGLFKENPRFLSSDLAVVIGSGFKIPDSSLKFNGLPFTVEKHGTFLTFDFGKIIVGYPKIEIESLDGGTIDFGFAETLKAEGTPDVAKMVSQADELTFNEGSFSYFWRQRRAFRYAILIFKNFKSPIVLSKFYVEAVNYPADDNESYFVSSDKDLDSIFDIAKYTVKIARQGNFEDCPHRERAQYVGDMRIVSLVNYYNYSNKELIRKALWEFALSQEKDGFVRAVYPAGRRLLIPDYSAQWVSASWEYYMYSGDLLFLKNIYPFLRKQIEGFINYSDQDGLVRSQDGWWIFIDQGDQEMNLDKSISLNIFYLEALKSIANAANELGNKADAVKYEKLGEDVSKLINNKAWNNKTGLYDDCITGNSMCDHFSRQTNYLALHQNIVDPKKLNVLKHSLLNNHSLPDIITPYFNSFVVEALFKNQFNNEAINLVRNYWGGMIKNGATTFWETYDTKTGKENTAYGESLSHGWSSAPAYLLPKWILGVKPLEPGYLSFRVEPIFIDLNYAKGKIPVDYEKSIEVNWKKEGHLEINIRYNFPAKAEILLPYHGEKKATINNNQIKDLKYDGSKVKFWIDKPGDYKIVLSD